MDSDKASVSPAVQGYRILAMALSSKIRSSSWGLVALLPSGAPGRCPSMAFWVSETPAEGPGLL